MRSLTLDSTRAIGAERIGMGKRSRVAPLGSISPCAAHMEPVAMLTLFSYPDLFGVADNNPYGLKVFAFLKLCGLPFRHEHVFDTTNAPRAQLPYLVVIVSRSGTATSSSPT
jgi:hypothetical protein